MFSQNDLRFASYLSASEWSCLEPLENAGVCESTSVGSRFAIKTAAMRNSFPVRHLKSFKIPDRLGHKLDEYSPHKSSSPPYGDGSVYCALLLKLYFVLS